MRNHFLRAKGVAGSGGGDSGGDSGGGATCGANDSGGTNEWAFSCAKGNTYFDGSNDFTASIDTVNKISYLAAYQSGRLRIRKITNTGTISWAKKYAFSGTDYSFFEPRKGKSLSTGKQVFIAQVNYSGAYYVTVICINADGSVEWCKRITPGSNSSSEGEPYHLTIDSNDNIYFTFEGDEPNADGTAGSNRRFFVLKLNSSGVIQWQKVFKSLSSTNSFISSFTHPNGLAVDSNYLYITNTRNNALSQQIVTLNVSDGTVYAVKHWGSDGTTRAKPATFDFKSHSGSFLVKDSSGDFYMLYIAKNSSNARRDVFITKFDSSYTVDWSTKLSIDNSHFYRSGNSGGFAITVTPNVKNLIFSCIVINTSDSDFEMLYIAKFDSSGSLDWQRVIKGVPDDGTSAQSCDRVNTLESDNADHFYLSGHLPWTRSNAIATYNFYSNKVESILKHSSCSAIPTGYITDYDPHSILSSMSGSPSGFGKIEDTSVFSQSSASCVIQSTPFSDDNNYGSVYTATNPTGNFSTTSETVTVTDLTSSDRFEDLTYL